MSIKVFISYVWEQSPFTNVLVNLIGRDIAVLDKHSFERSSLLEKEIEEYIRRCPIVISLLSYDALHDAPYIEMELQIIEKLIAEGVIKHYKPFLIGDNITVDNVRAKYPWILNYQLEKVSAPIFVERIVDQFITELKWEINPSLKARDNILTVRLDDLAKIQEKYYVSNSSDKKALIISGFPNGIGRTKLLKEFLLRDLAPNKPKTYNPPILKLESGDSIDEFIMFLNDWLLQYNDDDLLEKMLESNESRINIAVQMLNVLADKTQRVFIKDEDCIIQGNGRLNTWIKEIINSKDLCNQLHLFIASNHFLRKDESDKEAKVINVIIQPLSPRERTILFNAYANNRGVKLSPNQLDFFIGKTSGIPEVIFNLIDSIKDESIDYVETNIDKITKNSDKKIKLLLEHFKSEDYVSVLILLSSFPNITFKILNSISYNIIEDVDTKLQDLYCYSLIERYGSNNQYLSVNRVVSDYLERYRISLDTEKSILLKKNLINYFKELNKDDDSFDLTSFVYNVENEIKHNKKGIKSKYLIPSIVIKIIREEYRLGHDSEVIIICKRFLEERRANSFDEVIREIKFWMCQSMARSSNKEFFDWVNDFDNVSKNFLTGFYFRFEKNGRDSLMKAQKAYEKALVFGYENSNSEKMRTRIRQELVIVLQKRGRYQDALDLAEENYNSYPENSYYIVAYFRSLVRNVNKRKNFSILDRLIEELKSSLDPMGDAFVSILEGEYEYFVNGHPDEAIAILENGIATTSPQKRRSIYTSLLEICKKQESEPIAENIRKKYNITSEEN